MPYHMRLLIDNEPTEEVKLDVDDLTLERQFLTPYREGRAITIGGSTIGMRRIRRIRISHSDVDSSVLRRRLIADDLAMGGGDGEPDDSRVAAAATDVTDSLIMDPPGGGATDVTPVRGQTAAQDKARTVFLVHGRWKEAAEAMRVFLNALGLTVVEWSQARRAAQASGGTNPVIGEILDAGLELAHAIVVLMTPDDLVCLHPRLVKRGEPPEVLSAQPRPNVIFEAGMAWERDRDKTVLVAYGTLRGFSDLQGVYIPPLDESAGSRRRIVADLRSAGCLPDDSGDRWLEVRFPPPLRKPSARDLGFPTR
jgi:predicted nucleotide-binding protein